MRRKESIRPLLTSGDRRSIGRVDEVIQLVQAQPERMGELIECLWDSDASVRMRAADAVEKISRSRPDLLQPYKASLLGVLAEASQQELRWHLALMLPRLQLTCSECQRTADLLKVYLEDKSSIVKTCAMQGLFDLTRDDVSLLPSVVELLEILTRTGTPAMRARGRILLKQAIDSQAGH